MRISDWSSDVCSSDLRAGTYAVARRITFGLDVNPVKSQLILIDHTINAIVSAAPERTPSFSNRSAIAHGKQKVDDQPLKEVRWCCAHTIQQILCQRSLDPAVRSAHDFVWCCFRGVGSDVYPISFLRGFGPPAFCASAEFLKS